MVPAVSESSTYCWHLAAVGLKVKWKQQNFLEKRHKEQQIASECAECVWLAVFTSVNEHESLPQAHTQEGVLHHQTRQASCQVPLWSWHVIDYPPVPGGEQRMWASIPLSANTPWLGTFPVRPEMKFSSKSFSYTQDEFAERDWAPAGYHAQVVK